MSLILKRLFGQKKTNVSPLVLRSFKSKFPAASHILWQQIDAIKWHANFNLKKEKCTALFNSEGQWLETVTLIPLHKIPEQIKLTLDEKNNKDELRQIYHVQTPDRNIYELNLNNGRYTLKLLYDISGKILGKIVA